MPAKKNITIIIPGGIGTGKNNIGVPALERIIKLIAAEFSVTVFQLYRTNPNYKVEGFELIDIPTSNPISRILTFVRLFREYHRRRKFTAVHGFWALPGGFLAVLAGKLFRLKSVVSLQGGDAIALPEIRYGQLQKWLPRKLVLWTLHQADELVSPSRYMIDNLKDIGLNREDVKYIPLGIDVSKFRFLDRPITTPVKFLHIGNFNHVKDQKTLLKAFQIISKHVASELTIIGEGELERDVRRLIDELQLNEKVILLPPVPYDSLPAHYHQANILLHTSLSEGHPIVVEEAMSCGVLVCGTCVGLLYDLPDCGVAVKVKDFQSLAEATLKLLDDPQRMEAMKYRAFEWASKHSDLWTLAEIKNIYLAGHRE